VYNQTSLVAATFQISIT